MNSGHLTDEQFASILAGDHGDVRARLHVESCVTCQRELTLLGAAIVAGGRWLKWDARFVAVAGGLACFAMRVTAYTYAWHLPRLTGG